MRLWTVIPLGVGWMVCITCKNLGLFDADCGIEPMIHAPKPASTVPLHSTPGPKPSAPKIAKFDYETYYNEELEKKHKDKSYRYFNNINRLAQEFPRAHMATKEGRVTVWCSNDYLGMGRESASTKDYARDVGYVRSRCRRYQEHFRS